MRKILFSFFILLFFYFFCFTQIAKAQDNFLTDYSSTYNILDNGLTKVNFKISLTNKTANYYASSYKIQLGVSDIENPTAADGQGAITPEISKGENGNNVSLTFNQRVVGLNNKLSFSFSFDTRDISSNLGKILEVNIPGIENQNDFNSFDTTVIAPQRLGAPSYIKPQVVNPTSNVVTFTKAELGKSGVYIAYGREQAYSFNLTYHLYNKNLFPIKTEIALPPKTNYQNIQIAKISPKPQNVRIDEDGNWLAQYTLAPSQRVSVVVDGKALISLVPEKEELPESELAKYLKEKPFWETSNPEIKKLASDLATPEAIYAYVVKKLSYDFSRVTDNKPRLGAKEALANPTSAVCLEFTDLFIALARSAGIPAREVDGYAYTKNTRERPLSLVKDVLHAWPQYYDRDSKTWVMVDPTWGSTTGGVDYFHTLDFDHLAFVIKGMDSNYPIPAGGYKTSADENKKDVLVSVDTAFVSVSALLKAELQVSKSSLPWIPVTGKIIIKNEGNEASPTQDITIKTKFLKPQEQKVRVGAIPPNGKVTIFLNFKSPLTLTNKEDEVTITLKDKSFSQKILISPFAFSRDRLLPIGGVLIVIFAFIISAITGKFRYLHFFR